MNLYFFKKIASRNLLYLLLSFGLGLIVFTLFRVVMYSVFKDRLENVEDATKLVLDSMLMGLRFDIVISCYILSIPLLFVIISEYFRKISPYLMRFVKVYVPIVYSIAFLLCLIDIPFFEQFNLRLNSAALNWLDSPKIMFGMILTQFSYIVYLICFILFLVTYLYTHSRMSKKINSLHIESKKWVMLPVFIVVIAIFILGTRGRVSQKSPIRVGTAYFSNNSFINQMSLNPIFFFIKTVADESKGQKINLKDSDKAKTYVMKNLSRNENLERFVKAHEEFNKMNVVVILMESMASIYLETQQQLVPNLTSFKDKSLYFSNIYSGGIHTFNGIYSTLVSYPGYMQHHTMKGSIIPNYGSITSEFRSKDYRTMFFLTHDEQFDNIGGFLSSNDVEKIVSEKDYPAKEVKTSLGVPDHVMFNRAIEELTEVNNTEDKPFLTYILTCSNHTPHYLPTDIPFTPKSERVCEQMVEYSDWAIKDFLDNASSCEWFDNTLFVLVGDHGKSTDSKYNISLTYNHTPLLFYSPQHIKPEIRDCYGCQIDVLPTICGVLNMSYTNRTFGVDLLQERREYAYFCADGKLGAINDEWLYVYDENSGDYLYNRSEEDGINCANIYPDTLNNMREYVFSMTQAAYDKAID